MKIVREYSTEQDNLLCKVSFLPDEEEMEFPSSLSLRCSVGPDASKNPCFDVVADSEIGFAEILSEIERFCFILKQMYL